MPLPSFVEGLGHPVVMSYEQAQALGWVEITNPDEIVSEGDACQTNPFSFYLNIDTIWVKDDPFMGCLFSRWKLSYGSSKLFRHKSSPAGFLEAGSQAKGRSFLMVFDSKHKKQLAIVGQRIGWLELHGRTLSYWEEVVSNYCNGSANPCLVASFGKQNELTHLGYNHVWNGLSQSIGWTTPPIRDIDVIDFTKMVDNNLTPSSSCAWNDMMKIIRAIEFKPKPQAKSELKLNHHIVTPLPLP